MTNSRSVLIQTLLLVAIAVVFSYFYNHISQHLNRENIASGFEFLWQPAGFDIIMHVIDFTPASTKLRAFFVGVLNTLLVSALAIIFSTLLGNVIAYSRMSRNWLLQRAAASYVGIFSNLPLLLLVLFCYFALLQYMPQIADSYKILGLTINVRGISIGNITLIPEFTALLLALTLYAASHIAEIIRHGVLSVHKGQLEAAYVLGFTPWQRFRLIIFPQSARVILPPIIVQHLNIIKNSSLGVAIGYPELVSVFEGTVLNQTGQAVEAIFMTMSFYLIVSLVTSHYTNKLQHKLAIPNK